MAVSVKFLVEQKLEAQPDRPLVEIWSELQREHPHRYFGWNHLLSVKRKYLQRKEAEGAGEKV